MFPNARGGPWRQVSPAPILLIPSCVWLLHLSFLIHAKHVLPLSKGGKVKVRIGELAKLTGCQTVTIRFYEKEGLLNAPERTEGNYRLYDEDDIERLRFIRHCRQHGISLPEISSLLEFSDNPTVNCEWINSLIQKHIIEVNDKIKDLLHLKEHLELLQQKCPGGKGRECGILENLRKCDECAYCRQAMSSKTHK